MYRPVKFFPSQWRFRLAIALAGTLFLSCPVFGEEPEGKQVSSVREFAYGKSGEWLYQSLSKLHWPSTRPLGHDERLFPLAVDWCKQAKENTGGFPYLFPSSAVYSATPAPVTALFTCFAVKYHDHAGTLFDSYFQAVETSPYLHPKAKKLIHQQADLMRDRAIVFYSSFDGDRVQLVYYPGKIRFKGGVRRHLEKWLPGVREEEKSLAKSDYALIQDTTGLLALFNNVFDESDNFVWWNQDAKKRRYGGLGFEDRVFLPPQDEMATLAFYEGGRMEIGTYANLPHPEKIRTFIQNRFMVIEKGRPGKDEFPDAFCGFYDNIARSYLFRDKQGRVGYLWTLYTPPSVLVPLALEMGVEDMMLLDIHSPVAATVSDPKGPYHYSDFRDFMRRSFDLVPNFFRLYPLRSSIVWLSKALSSGIQNHYILEAFQNGDEGYFGLFLQGSPEALRMEMTQPPATKTLTLTLPTPEK